VLRRRSPAAIRNPCPAVAACDERCARWARNTPAAGRRSSTASRGVCQASDTPMRPRLVAVTVTVVPSATAGSSEPGRRLPSASEIAADTVATESSMATSVAANAAARLCPSSGSGPATAWKTCAASWVSRAKSDRLKTSFSGLWRAPGVTPSSCSSTSAASTTARPIRPAARRRPPAAAARAAPARPPSRVPVFSPRPTAAALHACLRR
jgi:hypothetical protein